MSPFKKRKDERDAEEKARRQARREELSARLRGELGEGGGESKGSTKAGNGPGEGSPREPEGMPAAKQEGESKAKSKGELKSKAAPEPKGEAKKPDKAAQAKTAPEPTGKSDKPEKAEKPRKTSKPERSDEAAKARTPKRRSFLRGRDKSGKREGKPARGTRQKRSSGRSGAATPEAESTASERASARAKAHTERGKAGKKGRGGRSNQKTSRTGDAAPSRAPGSKPTAKGKKPGSKRRGTASRRESIAKGAAAARAASSRGLRATAKRAESAGPLARKGLSRVGKVLTPVLVFILRFAGLIQRAITTVLSGGRRSLAWTIRTLDRLLTPARVVVALTLACAACMVVAQYVDYRGVEIGQPEYSQVADIAPAPQVDVHQAADNHSFVILGLQVSLIVPIALLAALIAVAALAGNRRRLGLLVSLAGVAGILITLLVDRPRGLDEGQTGLAFAGAHATLAEGFYAELAASAGLILCGLLLSLHLRPASARSRGKRRRPSPSETDSSKRRTAKKRARPATSMPKGVGKGDSPLAKGSS